MPQVQVRGYAWRQPIALASVVLMILPLFLFSAPPANATQLLNRQSAVPGQAKPGMSTGKKLALVAGAALLYYLYRRHVAAQAAAQKAAPVAGQAAPAAASKHAQLYRSRNGGIYYRDPQGKPVWLTVPSQPVQVPVDDLQKYAPEYNKISGPAPAAPAGYKTQKFSDFSPADTSDITANQ